MNVLKVIAAAVLLMPSSSAGSNQDADLLKVLSAVDQRQRPQLARRLRLFIDLQRKEEWNEVYKLIDQINADHWRGRDFGAMMSGFGYVDFVPNGSANDDDGHGFQYRVFGCVKVVHKNEKPVWLRSGLVAYFQSGDWYFTPYYLQFDGNSSRLPCEQPIEPSLRDVNVLERRPL